MNGKTAKLLRLYVGMRKRAGRAIALRDVKRRYKMTPWNLRSRIREGMMAYILENEPKDRRELRASRPRWGNVESARRGGLLQFVASLFGLAR